MAQSDIYIGRQIGNYRITKKLAMGGFGGVYLAQHIILAERVAVFKLLLAIHLDSQQESESFLREAQFLEKLKHPYILSIYDVGIDGNVPYLIAEYAPNGSLRNRIDQRANQPFPQAEAFTILSQVGAALQHAHDLNIIHRDIKPENMLFNAKDQALLADFGIATALSNASFKFTRVVGTPSYMAPEQFQGIISKETDQYALGCVAYELYTGQRPFIAQDTMSMMYKHLNDTPAAPRKINVQLPVHVEQAILRAMAKDRNNRYPDIEAFIAALEAPQPQYGLPPTVQAVPIAPPPVPSGPQYAYVTPPRSGQQQMYVAPPQGKPIPYVPAQQMYNGASYQPQQVFAPNPMDVITQRAKLTAAMHYVLPVLFSIFLLPWAPVIQLVYWLIVRTSNGVKHSRFVNFHFLQAMLLFLWVDGFVIFFRFVFGPLNDRYATSVTNCAQRVIGSCRTKDSLGGLILLIAVPLIVLYLILFIQWLRGIVSAFRGRYVKVWFVGKQAEKLANKRPTQS